MSEVTVTSQQNTPCASSTLDSIWKGLSDWMAKLDGFAFAATDTENPGPVRVGAEYVGLAGYSRVNGGYINSIVGGSMHLGSEENYVGVVRGVEFTANGPESISIYEGSAGAEVPFLGGAGAGGGYFSMSNEHGLFLYGNGGFLGEHLAGGFGFSLPSFLPVCK